MAKKNFEQWLKDVNESVRKRTGLDLFDLPDCPYRDWFEDGMRPASAAAKAIRMAME